MYLLILERHGEGCDSRFLRYGRISSEKAKVAVVPGDGFRAPGCLRLSYSNSYEKLSEGIERIEEALKELK